jgi:hypothetical protein
MTMAVSLSEELKLKDKVWGLLKNPSAVTGELSHPRSSASKRTFYAKALFVYARRGWANEREIFALCTKN